MSLYIQQLKIDIEKGKLSDNIAKLEKQINKEKKLIRRGRTKGLIKEHEVNNLFPFKFCHHFGVYPKWFSVSLARIKSALKITSAPGIIPYAVQGPPGTCASHFLKWEKFRIELIFHDFPSCISVALSSRLWLQMCHPLLRFPSLLLRKHSVLRSTAFVEDSKSGYKPAGAGLMVSFLFSSCLMASSIWWYWSVFSFLLKFLLLWLSQYHSLLLYFILFFFGGCTFFLVSFTSFCVCYTNVLILGRVSVFGLISCLLQAILCTLGFLTALPTMIAPNSFSPVGSFPLSPKFFFYPSSRNHPCSSEMSNSSCPRYLLLNASSS